MKRIYMTLLLFIGCSSLWLGAQDPADRGTSFQPGALYVQFKESRVNFGKSDTRYVPVRALFPVKSLVDPYGFDSLACHLRFAHNEILDRTFKISFDSVQKTEALIAELSRDPRISVVERVPRMKICCVEWDEKAGEKTVIPNDPLFGTVDSVRLSWHLTMLGYEELYGRYQGDPTVKVAVVDNAVWEKHEDLTLAVENLYDVSTKRVGTASPPDLDQEVVYSPEMVGFNQAYQWSHGTHCSGLIGATTDNSKGISSLASGVTLMGVRTAAVEASLMDYAIEGVIWAAGHGARVISMSFSGSYRSQVEEEVYTGCVKKGIVMVAAAGNDNNDHLNYPAAYPGIIAVGSVDSDGKRSYFSNYGDWVDIWSPGGFYVEDDSIMEMEQIFSTTYCVTQYYADKQHISGRYYDAMVGTSMATPLAASAVALLLSYYPELNGYQVKEVLQRTMRNNCIYPPAALAFLEEAASRQVRNLRAGWDPTGKTLEMRWDAPEAEGVTAYRIYHGEEKLGECLAADRSFSIPLTDTAGFVGVRAMYTSDSGLVCYTRVRPGIPSATEFLPEAHPEELLHVRVNRSEKTLELLTDEDFDRIEIYDMCGVKVLDIPGRNKQIDMQPFARGLYIGKALRGQTVRTFKAVL